MTSPLVSAIVSTYAAERFMRGCLEDLEAQTIADRLEIIVVDSNSPQNEAAIVREFQQRYDNIRYIRTPERETLYAAWNRGIAAATAKYVTSANTDDRHFPQAFERMVESLESSNAVLAYADAAVTLRENAAAGTFRPCVFLRWPEFDRRLLFQVDFVGSQPVWRRDLHERYGLFDADFIVSADYEFWLRVARQETFLHVPETLGVYLASRSSIEHRHPDRTWRESETARLRYWNEEWGTRPRPHGFFLRFAWGEAIAALLRGNLTPAREIATHVAMLAGGRLHRGKS